MTNEGSNFSFMGSDGGLQTYFDPYANVTTDDVALAEKAEQIILDEKWSIECSYAKLAFLLDKFDQERLYLARSCATMKEWCAGEQIDISWRLAQDLIRIQREVIPILETELGPEHAVTAVGKVGVSKVRAMLPLLRDDDGEQKVVDLVDRLLDPAQPKLNWDGVRAEVKQLRGQEEPIDKKYAAVFKIFVRKSESHSRIRLVAMDGVRIEQLATFMLPNEWLARFEYLFGEFVEQETS